MSGALWLTGFAFAWVAFIGLAFALVALAGRVVMRDEGRRR